MRFTRQAIKRWRQGSPPDPEPGPPGPALTPLEQARAKRKASSRYSGVVRYLQVISLIVALGLLASALWGLRSSKQDQAAEEPVQVHLTGAVKAIQRGDVTVLHLNDVTRKATLVLADGREVYTVFPEGFGPELATLAREADVSVVAVPTKRPSVWTNLLLTLLPVALLIGFFIFFLGPRMGLKLGMSKSKRKPAEVPATRFTDVAGVDEAVSELSEVVEYLHSPDRFAKAGARVPRGFLLVGPPGTGKTLLARAVAGEAGVPFFSLAGSDFVETFVGVGASRVRQIFAAARKVAPAIVFIDELDAVGKTRSTTSVGGGTEERENTLNQLLVEMDGFVHSGLIVLAATNRADVLDAALTRPGRFDRHIVVPAPDRTGREQILRLYARERNLAPDVDLEALARRTPGLTGADLAGLVNEAALEAARRGSDVVTEVDIQSALATSVLGRERRSAVITDRDRTITAWHEAGHAVAALALPHANDPVSVTIIPRGPAGGVTWMGGNDNTFTTRSEAEESLVVSMAGRAAEEVLLQGDYTSGAASDFAEATKLAVAMVTQYGMSDLGVTCRAGMLINQGTNSEQVVAAVDTILGRAMQRARDVIAANLDLVTALVAELMETETVDGRRLAALAAAHPAHQPAADGAVPGAGPGPAEGHADGRAPAAGEARSEPAGEPGRTHDGGPDRTPDGGPDRTPDGPPSGGRRDADGASQLTAA